MTQKRSLVREILLTLRSTAVTSSSYQWFGYASSVLLLVFALSQVVLSSHFAKLTTLPPATALGHGLMLGGLSWVMGFLSRRRDLGWGTVVLLVIGSLLTILDNGPAWLGMVAPWFSIVATLWLLTRSLLSIRTWPEMALAVRLGLIILLIGQGLAMIVVQFDLRVSPSYSVLWANGLLLPATAAWLFGFSQWRSFYSTMVTTLVAVSGAALVLTCGLWLLNGPPPRLVSTLDMVGTLMLCLGVGAIATAVLQRVIKDVT
jgi:hypothetical protein